MCIYLLTFATEDTSIYTVSGTPLGVKKLAEQNENGPIRPLTDIVLYDVSTFHSGGQ